MNKRILSIISAVFFSMTFITVNATGSVVTTTNSKTSTGNTTTSTSTTTSTTTSTESKDSTDSVVVAPTHTETGSYTEEDTNVWSHESRTFTFEETSSQTSYYDTTTGTIVKDNSVFPSQYHIDEDGYVGYIPLVRIDWSDNYIRNRTEEISRTETVTIEEGQPVPETKTVEVTDPVTKKKVQVQLKKKSASKISDKTETEYTTDTGFFRWLSNYSDSYPGNDGSSSSKDSKWSSYSDAPDDNSSYYGTLKPSDRGKDLYHEYKSPNVWAWGKVYSAEEAKNSGVDSNVSYDKSFGYYYNAYSTSIKNKYGKGVTQTYSFPDGNKTYITYTVVYQGTAYYEDYIASSRGTAYYKGTLTKSVAILDNKSVDNRIGSTSLIK